MRKTIRPSLLLIIFAFLNCGKFNSVVDLSGKWAFFIGDDLKIAEQTLLPEKHSKFEKYLTMPGRYFKQGYQNLSGYTWLRKSFVLTSNEKSNLGVFLGELKSVDATFFNGEQIGGYGSFPPNVNQAFDRKRIYSIPSHLIRPGKNTIAIRLYEPPPQNRGGIKARSIFIAHYDQLYGRFHLRLMILAILSFSALLLGTYFLLQYHTFQDSSESLFFGIISVTLGAYLFFYGELKYLFFNNFLILKKVEHCLLFIVPVAFLQYIFQLTRRKNKTIIRLAQAAGSVSIVLAIAMPSIYWMLKVLWLWQVYLIIIFLFCIYMHIRYRSRSAGVWVYHLLAYVSLTLIAIIDIFRSWNLHTFPKMIEFGFVSYLFLNGVALIKKINQNNANVKDQLDSLSKLTENTSPIETEADIISHYNFLLRNKLNLNAELFIHTKSNVKPRFKKRFMMIKDLDVKKNFSKRVHPEDYFFEIPIFIEINDQTRTKAELTGTISKDRNLKNIQYILDVIRIEVLSHLKQLEYRSFLKNANLELEKKVLASTIEIREKNSELRKLNRIKTDFFANITHDIKTPLSLLTIPLEKIRSTKADLDEKERKALDKIKYNIYRITMMLSSLLDIARIESSDQSTNFSTINFRSFVNSIVSDFRDVIETKSMKLELFIEEKEIYAAIDVSKFEKVITNLLSNAIKYNRTGKAIEVQLKLSDEIILKIKDYGIGIPRKEIPYIFTRYRQVLDKTGLSRIGSGLGLALVKEYVELHQGEVSVKSKEGEYTEFSILLPNTKGNHVESSYQDRHYTRLKLEELSVDHIRNQPYAQDERKTIVLISKDNELIQLLEKQITHSFDLVIIDRQSELQTKNLIGVLIDSDQKTNLQQFEKDYLPYLILDRSGVSSDANTINIPFHPLELWLYIDQFYREMKLRHRLRSLDTI